MRFPASAGRLLPAIAVVASLCVIAFFSRPHWTRTTGGSRAEEQALPVEEPKVLKLTPQARKNLKLVSQPANPQVYWRKIQIPGTIVDRPGHSDRGVTSPAVGVVNQVHAFPGDTVRIGDRLFTVRLFSEYLQKTQKELFSSTRETEFIEAELDRLRPLAEEGGIAKRKIIDLENQLRRQAAVILAHRQDLLTRGLDPAQIESVAQGKFVSTVDILAPPLMMAEGGAAQATQVSFRFANQQDSGFAYEVQELHAELGQQVQAGQLLSTLANHGALFIEGHAFKREAPLLEAAAQNGWNITVEFTADAPKHWPRLDQTFEIRHLSNAIDTASRTFAFFIPLENQSRSYQRGNDVFVVWRFRPGQRVRLHVPVEQLNDVLVLPAAAVVWEGPEAYVFQQNGDLFNRLPVQVLYEDRLHVVLADDGSVTRGVYLAQNAAASLNRVLKAQSASGMRADIHVHADGTVHAAH